MTRAANSSSTSVSPSSPSSAAKFAAAARVLSEHVRRVGLVVPGFRCPPRIIGVDRTVRRAQNGQGAVVAVRIANRPFTAAVADMIEGVIVVNRLEPPEADRVRDELWRVMLAFTVSLFDSPSAQARSHGEHVRGGIDPSREVESARVA